MPYRHTHGPLGLKHWLCDVRFAFGKNGFAVFPRYFPTVWASDDALVPVLCEKGRCRCWRHISTLASDVLRIMNLQTRRCGRGNCNQRGDAVIQCVLGETFQVCNRQPGTERGNSSWTCSRNFAGEVVQIDCVLGNLCLEIVNAWYYFAVVFGSDQWVVHCQVRCAIGKLGSKPTRFVSRTVNIEGVLLQDEHFQLAVFRVVIRRRRGGGGGAK